MSDAPASLEARHREIVRLHGPWTAHNVHLGEGVWTMGTPGIAPARVRRILQIVRDLAPRPLHELRVLDLACLEGQFAIELAMHGARGLGIEGRETSVAKAKFARDALGLERLDFVQGDVRDLSEGAHGRFDVVLCLGIHYHLDAPDVFELTDRIASVCDGIAIFDTHVSLSAAREEIWRGRRYLGSTYREHRDYATEEERSRALWASLDNADSFWLTRESLLRSLADVGFTSVLEAALPAVAEAPPDRVTFVAVKGEPVEIRSSPGSTPSAATLPEGSLATARRWGAALGRQALPRLIAPLTAPLHAVRRATRRR